MARAAIARGSARRASAARRSTRASGGTATAVAAGDRAARRSGSRLRRTTAPDRVTAPQRACHGRVTVLRRRLLVVEARRDLAELDWLAGAAARLRRVLGDADAGEEQRRERLAQQRRDLAVEERHPGCAGAESVGGEVEPALDEAGRELGLAVLAVVERAQVGGADHDEGRVARQAL